MSRTFLAAALLFGMVSWCQADEPTVQQLRPSPAVRVARLVDSITSRPALRQSDVPVYAEGSEPNPTAQMLPPALPWSPGGQLGGHQHLIHNCRCTNEPYTYGLWTLEQQSLSSTENAERTFSPCKP